jgi:hypothetical protein
MWTWALTAYLITFLAIGGCSGFLALFSHDPRRARRAGQIFKITISTTLGSTGIVAVILHLYELGILG